MRTEVVGSPELKKLVLQMTVRALSGNTYDRWRFQEAMATSDFPYLFHAVFLNRTPRMCLDLWMSGAVPAMSLERFLGRIERRAA